MKKTLLFCTIMLVSTFCFSQEKGRYGDIEFWGGMPFISGRLDHAGNETIKTEMPFSFGIGTATYGVFGVNNFGIVFFANLAFSETLLHTIDGQETRYTHTGNYDIAISLSDMYFGFGCHLLGQKNAFRIPFTFGAHLFSFSGSLESPGEAHTFYIRTVGFGASIAAELHVASSFYFFFRLQGSFDFYYNTSISNIIYAGSTSGKSVYFIDSREFSAISTYFGVTPSIGFGLKLDGRF